MPHAHNMPMPGFQALILCGPGASLNTFTSSPDDFPKALIPIANRPMVWYPLEWCYRMGVTNIQLVTPPSSASAIESALSKNTHLKSLTSSKPTVLAPAQLSQNTGTAAALRLPEVQAAVTGDFIVLPCDIVCELGGESLLESWMVRQAGVGGVSGRTTKLSDTTSGGRFGGEESGRRGGLGVWYQTKGVDDSVKGEETDFVATAALPPTTVRPPPSSLLPHIANLLYSLPTDTLNDIAEEKKTFPIRHSMLRKHGRVKMLTTHRDAHIYFLPLWVMEMVKRNEKFDSLSEDVVGWWAKAGWQDGLGDKLGLREILQGSQDLNGDDPPFNSGLLDDEVDVMNMSTTWTSQCKNKPSSTTSKSSPSTSPSRFASRVQRPSSGNTASSSQRTDDGTAFSSPNKYRLTVPPILAYIHPTASPEGTSAAPIPPPPLIHRIDTVPLLLSLSLRLARLPSLEDAALPPPPQHSSPAQPSPFAHKAKITSPALIAPRSTVTRADCLLDALVTVAEKCVVKESVLGNGCAIAQGARLTRCLLMEGVNVKERARLDGCVVGRGAIIGEGAVLRDCEVQEGYVVPDKTDAKNEKFLAFEGLDAEDGEDGFDVDAEGTVLGFQDGQGDGEGLVPYP
ncbi:MAG: hypothetical protein M1837_006976 [Sclerophora amabilis]|nr:MAG: hypothetical protein M1837_006976 [Sclerophora amabilis]